MTSPGKPTKNKSDATQSWLSVDHSTTGSGFAMKHIKSYDLVPHDVFFAPVASMSDDFTPVKVELVVDHVLSELRNWLNEPHTKGAVLIHELGTFELNLRAINKRLRNMIPFLRGEDRDHYIPRFRKLWARRQLALAYEIKRNSTNRRFIFSNPDLND